MIALPSIQSELAAAVRRVNAAYRQAGEPATADLAGPSWDRAEAEVNAAMQSGERSRALAAIRSWELYALDRIEEATR